MPISLKNINKEYNGKPIFKDFSFTFEEGNIYVITGPIGVGKTTLLNILAGITSIDSGTIEGIKQKTISYLFQENRLLKNKNVSENIGFILKDTINKEESKIIIEKYLKLLNLYEYKDYNINNLSGGMQRKLAIARSLAFPSYDLLILDEPFNNIDENQRDYIMNNIMNLINEKTILILVTHNAEYVKNM